MQIYKRSGSEHRADSMYSPLISWTGTAADDAVRIWEEIWSSSTIKKNRYRLGAV